MGGRLVSVTGDYVVVDVLGDIRMNLMKGDVSLTPSISKCLYWESWITAWFFNNVEHGMKVYDIGANCGYYSSVAEKLGAEVIAFEASPHYAELLRNAKEEFGYDFKVKEIALGDKEGEVVLSYPGDYTGSASIMTDFVGTNWGEDKHISVKSTTLDNELKTYGMPDIVKIDAESAEEVIWNGGKSLWYSDNPPVVVLEYSPTGTYSKEFDEELFESGYVTGIGYDGVEHPIDIRFLNNLRDWYMIVWRRK